MQVANPNDVKIYNLSVGKSLPEWLSDRKRRETQKNDIDIRKRIELIQDFEMPGVSSCVQITNDGQYILATGIYKPRVRCFDVNQLSMKFERCFDSEAVKFCVLSEDYSKIVFLQCDRYVEFHAQYGRYYRLRIPKFGRDLAYHSPSCDLYIVGDSNEVYRLNLEQGRFLSPYVTDAAGLNVCAVNPVHHLFMCGTTEGRIEAWDPRSRHRAGILDCAFSCVTQDTEVAGIPCITSLTFRDGLTMAVGTATGQILLYDVRSDKPLLVKDHLYGLPVTNIHFHDEENLMISMDSKIVRIWDRESGKSLTSIEPGAKLNDLCVLPNTGLFFIANEDKKMLTYYIPALGPAPKWCAFLDNLTEELEENQTDTVYDDYKFVTKKELEDIGLTHLVGSNLLRAYMHGYFVDLRLYYKAKSLVNPFAFEQYRKTKIKEKMADETANRVRAKEQILPKVNKDLAQKLLDADDQSPASKKAIKSSSKLLQDNRFKALFENPDFEVDKGSEHFKVINPVVTKMGQNKRNKRLLAEQFQPVQAGGGDDEKMEQNISDEGDSSSSDEGVGWTQEVKRQHRLLKQDDRRQRRQEDQDAELKPKLYELRPGHEFAGLAVGAKNKKKEARKTLEERLQSECKLETTSCGEKQLTFTLKSTKQRMKARAEAERHHLERKKLTRSTKNLKGKPGSWRS